MEEKNTFHFCLPFRLSGLKKESGNYSMEQVENETEIDFILGV